jgi:hypothetical protein
MTQLHCGFPELRRQDEFDFMFKSIDKSKKVAMRKLCVKIKGCMKIEEKKERWMAGG